jgi:hypothetical protein
MVHRDLIVGDSSDTYVSSNAPKHTHGDLTKLVASNDTGRHKVSYLKFNVTQLPAGATVTHATATFTRTAHHMPATTLRLRRVASTQWSQAGLSDLHAPTTGATVSSARVNGSLHSATFRLHRTINSNGTYAFALVSTSRDGVVRLQSREADSPPELTLSYEFPQQIASKPPTSPTPTPTGSSSPTPSPTPTDPSSPTPTPTPTSPTPTPTSPTPTPTPTSPSSGPCTLSATLVPSCGTLFGGVTTSWGGSTLMSQYDDAVAGTGVHFALSHDYRRPGQVLSPYDIQVAKTPGALLQLNWKPASLWSQAGGGDATVNSQIDAMAQSIKSLGSTKIFLTIYHEPENDVTSDPNCPNLKYKGSAGTPTDYRAMWANVESRFAALGVTNVVWDMNYMNYSAWDCLVNDLWPGNSLVDWVMFESYSDNNSTFSSTTSHFYNLLTAQSDASHNYLSKPWGIGEFGTWATTPSVRDTYYSGVKSALDSNEFPKLKLLSIFDSPGVGGDCRVAYSASGTPDAASLSNFMTLVKDPSIAEGDQAAASH